MIRFLAIVAAVVVGDQLTKLWILNSFSLYESLEIIPGFFSLTYLTNKGAAFGFLVRSISWYSNSSSSFRI